MGDGYDPPHLESTSPLPAQFSLRDALAAAWATLLVFVLLRYSSAAPPPAALPYAMAAAGWAAAALYDAAALLAFVRRHRWLMGSAAVLAVLAFAAQATPPIAWPPPYQHVLPQPALLLCIAPLGFFFARVAPLQHAFGALAAVLALWHFAALPIEAMAGSRLGWNMADPLPRQAGPLNYQAAGLAHQAYFFAGLFLPLFYLGWGFVYEKLHAEQRPALQRTMVAIALLWVAAVACVQSRSALFGAALAGTLLAVTTLHAARRPAPWAIAGLLAVLLAVVYAVLFSDNKSGASLRLTYAALYWRESMQWPELIVGHGFSAVVPESLRIASYPVSHSHNDWLQVLYSWGLPALAAYAVFLAALVLLVWRRFVAQGVWWPAAALVALLPNMVTDLGIHHYEKAAFLVLLAALSAARRPGCT